VADLMNNFGRQGNGIEAKRNSDSEDEESKLISIAAKDYVTVTLCPLCCLTKERLEEQSTDFFAPIKRNKSKTFASLYKSSTTKSTKRSKVLNADRKILQRLLNAANCGRDMQIAGVLKQFIDCKAHL